ncbi:MAG: hypothetical protein AB9835_00890 [Eubacteriales bacterium]
MKAFIRKTTALLLAGLFAALPLASCSEQNKPADTGTTEQQVLTQSSTEVEKPTANVPEKDYEKYNFRILAQEGDTLGFNYNVDEQIGELVNDAIYIRNRNIEARFNISITQVTVTNPQDTARKSIMANDDTFDVIGTTITNLMPLRAQGHLQNLHDVPYLDISSPWWDHNLTEAYDLLGKLYFQTGDITIREDMRTACMIFNKTLFNEYNLEYPYKDVLDGNWTIDRLKELSKGVNKDVNGDGVMNESDIWGFVSEYAAGMDFYLASGEKVVALNDDGVPELVFNTPRAVQVKDKVLSLLTDSEAVFLADKIPDTAELGRWKHASNMFMNNQILIRSMVFEVVPRDLRNMEMDFGVLPFVKYDKAQKNYYSMVRADGQYIAVPVTNTDFERTGIILESLAAESVSTLTEAFYEKSLYGKFIRDEESRAMLDIIFAGKVYDIGHLYDVGKLGTSLNTLVTSGNINHASDYEKKEAAALIAIDKIVAEYESVT